MIFFLLFLVCFLLPFIFQKPLVVLLITPLLIYLWVKLKGKRKHFLWPLMILMMVSIKQDFHHSSSFISTKGIVCEANDNYYLLLTLKSKYYVYEKNNQKEIGDILKVRGRLQKLDQHHIESQFDFKEYLNNKGCYYQLYVNETQTIVKSLLKIKTWKARLKAKVDENTYQLCNMLLFGKYQDSPWKDMMMMTHFLPFFSIGSVFFRSLLKKMKDQSHKKKIFVLLGLITPFLILRPLRLLWWKLIIEALIEWYFIKSKSPINSLEKNSLCGLILLSFNPFLAYQSTFVLTCGIALVLALIRPLLLRFKKRSKRVIIFLIAQFLIMSYCAYNYYEINLLMPVLSLITPLLMGFYLIMSLLFFFNQYSLLMSISKGYQVVIKWLSKLSLNLIVGKISVVIILLFIGLLITTFYFHAKGIKKNKGKYAFFALFIVLILPYNNYIDRVTFIDVGQGDAILIESQNKTLLVDTGGSLYFDIASESLIPFFKKKRIRKIDYYVSSHNDFDHCGGLESLKEAGYVKKILDQDNDFPLKLPSTTIYDLNHYKNNFSDDNNRSRVLSFSLFKTSFLLMGDAGVEVENQLIKEKDNLHHDVIKIGHHGAKTSSSYNFLKCVSPYVAVISCGYKNIYHHPHKEVIDRLNKLNIKIRRTDEEGSIVIEDKNLFSFFLNLSYLWYTRLERRK